MGKLASSTSLVATLHSDEVNAMYELFHKYYENVTKEKFVKDLRDKDRVILLRDTVPKEKKIRGFCTLKEIHIQYEGKKVAGLFTGDTIIDAHYWGQTALSIEFFKNLLYTKLKSPGRELYWFLISKGYKTYLSLTNNFYNYYPRYDQETPAREKYILDTFATTTFGELYDPKTQILKCAHLYDRLKKGVAPIDDKSLKNKKIRYFQDKNPNWQNGEELCCIGRVDTALVKKFVTKTLKKKVKAKKQ